MRHSDISLTMNVYTDPRLLDIAGAVERLPDLPLTGQIESAAATGTTGNPSECVTGNRRRQFAPGFAPTSDKPATPPSIPGKMANLGADPKKRENPRFSKENQGFSDSSQVGVKGFEPSTSWSRKIW